jgi:hypothetical protein
MHRCGACKKKHPRWQFGNTRTRQLVKLCDDCAHATALQGNWLGMPISTAAPASGVK